MRLCTKVDESPSSSPSSSSSSSVYYSVLPPSGDCFPIVPLSPPPHCSDGADIFTQNFFAGGKIKFLVVLSLFRYFYPKLFCRQKKIDFWLFVTFQIFLPKTCLPSEKILHVFGCFVTF